MNVQFHKLKKKTTENMHSKIMHACLRGKTRQYCLYVVVFHWPPLHYHNKELQLMCHRDGPWQ